MSIRDQVMARTRDYGPYGILPAIDDYAQQCVLNDIVVSETEIFIDRAIGLWMQQEPEATLAVLAPHALKPCGTFTVDALFEKALVLFLECFMWHHPDFERVGADHWQLRSGG